MKMAYKGKLCSLPIWIYTLTMGFGRVVGVELTATAFLHCSSLISTFDQLWYYFPKQGEYNIITHPIDGLEKSVIVQVKLVRPTIRKKIHRQIPTSQAISFVFVMNMKTKFEVYYDVQTRLNYFHLGGRDDQDYLPIDNLRDEIKRLSPDFEFTLRYYRNRVSIKGPLNVTFEVVLTSSGLGLIAVLDESLLERANGLIVNNRKRFSERIPVYLSNLDSSYNIGLETYANRYKTKAEYRFFNKKVSKLAISRLNSVFSIKINTDLTDSIGFNVLEMYSEFCSTFNDDLFRTCIGFLKKLSPKYSKSVIKYLNNPNIFIGRSQAYTYNFNNPMSDAYKINISLYQWDMQVRLQRTIGILIDLPTRTVIINLNLKPISEITSGYVIGISFPEEAFMDAYVFPVFIGLENCQNGQLSQGLSYNPVNYPVGTHMQKCICQHPYGGVQCEQVVCILNEKYYPDVFTWDPTTFPVRACPSCSGDDEEIYDGQCRKKNPCQDPGICKETIYDLYDHTCILEADNTYSCNCSTGFNYNQTIGKCIDIDECTEGTHVCEQICQNSIGSYYCMCQKPYYKKPLIFENTCIDVNECTETNFCSRASNRECLNIEGGYECFCTPYHAYNIEQDKCEYMPKAVVEYDGLFCEMEPCNLGKCTQLADNNVQCDCDPDHVGDLCEYELNTFKISSIVYITKQPLIWEDVFLSKDVQDPRIRHFKFYIDTLLVEVINRGCFRELVDTFHKVTVANIRPEMQANDGVNLTRADLIIQLKFSDQASPRNWQRYYDDYSLLNIVNQKQTGSLRESLRVNATDPMQIIDYHIRFGMMRYLNYLEIYSGFMYLHPEVMDDKDYVIWQNLPLYSDIFRILSLETRKKISLANVSNPFIVEDIDECSKGLVKCHENADCINEPGFYRCDCLDYKIVNANIENPGVQCRTSSLLIGLSIIAAWVVVYGLVLTTVLWMRRNQILVCRRSLMTEIQILVKLDEIPGFHFKRK